MSPKVIKVQANTDYTLILTFANSDRRKFDVRPYLNIGDFNELKDLAIFMSVKPFMGSIQWSNELDFSPDTLYEEGQPI